MFPSPFGLETLVLEVLDTDEKTESFFGNLRFLNRILSPNQSPCPGRAPPEGGTFPCPTLQPTGLGTHPTPPLSSRRPNPRSTPYTHTQSVVKVDGAKGDRRRTEGRRGPGGRRWTRKQNVRDPTTPRRCGPRGRAGT